MDDFWRGLVRLQIILEGEREPRDDNHAYLECWTADNTMGAYQPVKTRASDKTGANKQLQLRLEQKWSPVKKGKDKSRFDLIIGKPGMS